MGKKSSLPGSSGTFAASSSVPAAGSSIAGLEKQLSAAGNADLNGLVDLLELLRDQRQKTKTRASAANALHNVFSTLIRQGRLIGKVKEQDAGNPALKAVRDWAKGRWSEYVSVLCDLLSDSSETLAVSRATLLLRHWKDSLMAPAALGPQTASLNMLMSLLRTTSEHLSGLQSPAQYYFDMALWRRIVQGLLVTEAQPTPALRAEFVNRYLNYNDDIRFYFLRTAG